MIVTNKPPRIWRCPWHSVTIPVRTQCVAWWDTHMWRETQALRRVGPIIHFQPPQVNSRGTDCSSYSAGTRDPSASFILVFRMLGLIRSFLPRLKTEAIRPRSSSLTPHPPHGFAPPSGPPGGFLQRGGASPTWCQKALQGERAAREREPESRAFSDHHPRSPLTRAPPSRCHCGKGSRWGAWRSQRRVYLECKPLFYCLFSFQWKYNSF